MKKSHRIIGIFAAAMVAAASLTLSGCGDADTPDEQITTDAEGQIYLSSNSLFSYTLNADGKTATLISYNGDAASVILNRIDSRIAITAIADGAFAGNTNLTKVELDEGILAIGEQAFYGCTSLESIVFRGNSKLQRIEENAFEGCVELKSFAIPASLKTIGAEAFLDCRNALIDFSKATGLTSIGEYAFSFCGSASTSDFTVTLPENLSEIGTGAFYGATKISAFEVSEKNPNYSAKNGILYNKSGDVLVLYPAAIGVGEEFTVPNGVSSIAGGAFAGAGITKITLPEGFISIGGSAFYNAYALQTVVIPESIESIGSFAFLECGELTSISIPDGTKLGSYLFRSCAKLTDVRLPADLTAIPDGLFDSCAKLASITLPQNITEIGQFAFNYCTSLTEIDIPKTVKTIKGYAFRNCASLKNIDVSSASEIGDFTFQYCAKLESADISGISEIPAYMFEGASPTPSPKSEIMRSLAVNIFPLSSFPKPSNRSVTMPLQNAAHSPK